MKQAQGKNVLGKGKSRAKGWGERSLSMFEEQKLMAGTEGVKGRIEDEVIEGEGARSLCCISLPGRLLHQPPQARQT